MSGKVREGNLGSFGSVVAGSAVNVENLSGVRALVSGTFVGTIKIEVSFDKGDDLGRVSIDHCSGVVERASALWSAPSSMLRIHVWYRCRRFWRPRYEPAPRLTPEGWKALEDSEYARATVAGNPGTQVLQSK